MSSTSTLATEARGRLTTRQKVGLVLCILYSLGNVPSVFFPAPEGEDGPPLAILAVCSILAVVALVAAVMAWRGNRVALRVAAGAIIVITITGLPAFFVDVPMAVKAVVGFGVVLTVVTVALMFSGERRPASVTD